MSIGGRTWPSTETCGDRSKRDLKSVDIDVDRWENLVIDLNKWRQEVREGLARSKAASS